MKSDPTNAKFKPLSVPGRAGGLPIRIIFENI